MIARSSFVLFLVVLLSGCSLFHRKDPPPPQGTVAAKKTSLWPFGKHGPLDATPYLEYRRSHSETETSMLTLSARNTLPTKTIEGEIRTTIETSANETKVDSAHFTLAPNETKVLLVYPERYHLTYEVSAFIRE